MKEKVGFLILHYCAIDETINCIDSIKKKVGITNYEIVVVDNFSSNGTGIDLKKKYKNDSKVTVILNKENLGFARGNNVGFKYLKNKLKCNYIVMLNNDVLVLSDDLFKKIKKEYKENKAAVIGPKIYNRNYELPFFPKNLISEKNLKKDILVLYILYILTCFHLIKLVFKLFKKGSEDNSVNSSDNCNDGVFKSDVLLHGCCLIFTPIYVNKFDGIDDRTFLYREEELLYVRLKQNDMLSIYSPNIEIQHLEDVSTNLAMPNFYKRRKKVYLNQIKSSKILLSEYRKER